ncbi:hypothetical protein WJX77_011371 [Trebouxia sp. C0004]
MLRPSHTIHSCRHAFCKTGQLVCLRQQFCKSFSLTLAQQRLRKQSFYTFKQPGHTKAASNTPSSVNSAIARNQEASAPAVAAASQQAQQNSKQPQEAAATAKSEITAVLDESKLRRESHGLHQAVPTKSNAAAHYLDTHKGARIGLYGAAIVLGGTLLMAAFRVFRKYNTPQNKRKRNVSKNKLVVESLQEFLPHKRSALTPSVTRSLKMKTGFNAAEIFRKYLWYLLRERKFDTEAVNDVVQLKSSLQLSDEEVSEAIQERAKRIYDKYGNVMLEVKGMTKAGVERKATCRALFSKLLYLAEYDGLLPQDTELARKTNVPDVFGATTEDTNGLRIVSLHEIDMDKLEGQFDPEDTEEGDEPQ